MRRWPALALSGLNILLFAGSFAPARGGVASPEIDTSCKWQNSLYYYPDTLKVVWKPLATLPALVRPGDTLTVWANAPNVPTNWAASLELAALSVPLAPAGGSFQSNL